MTQMKAQRLPPEEDEPVKRKRGRPRKDALAAPEKAQKAEIVAPGTTTVSVTATHPQAVLSPLARTGVDIEGERTKLKVLPGVVCSTCTIGVDCPQFTEGNVCAYEEAFNAFPARDVDSVLSLMSEVVDENKRRWRMALHKERTLHGGSLDPAVTRLSDLVQKQTRALIELQNEANKVTVSLSGSNVGPGILTRLFSKDSGNTG